MAKADSKTSTTLLRRLRRDPTDQEAWGEFVERYGRMIYRWCRAWSLQEADAEDVTQNVLLELSRQMRTFEYDPNGRFRGWLHTVAQRGWARFLETRRKAAASGLDGELLERLGAPAAGEDFLKHLEAECERELLETAMGLVRLRVRPHTWEAFRLLALEDVSGADAAEKLSMNVGAVFVARSKVQRMLREEVARLNGDAEGSSDEHVSDS